MKIFNFCVSEETKLSCIQRMLFNYVMELKSHFNCVDECHLQSFYRLLTLRKSVLTQILNCLEKNEKVVVFLDFDVKGKEHSVLFNVSSVDEYSWDSLFDGLSGNRSGLCLTSAFNGDRANCPWLFLNESELRGKALAKVFDI